MSKYSQGKIYKLTSSQTEKVYIGSTITSLDVRFTKHKSHYKSWINKTQMNKITSYDLLQYDDVKIELIKEFPCETKKELEKEEGKIMLENNYVNKCVAGRTKKESGRIHWNKNKERRKETTRIYRHKNKEKYCEKFPCECGGRYTYVNKSRHFKSKKHLKFVNQV
jgi:hypothetical protein